MRQLAVIVIVFVGILAFGCSEPSTNTATTQKAGLKLLPIEFTVRQRSTTAVPGSEGRLLITIDDITRNQVMTSAATETGTALLPSRSMSPGDTAQLNFEGKQLVLRLQRLDNALAGEDFAAFKVSAAGKSLTEKQKTERLIQDIAGLSGATFIRNGEEHSAAKAAEHLTSKWEAAGARITTAQQFIDGIASKSSMSGKPYQIRFADGRVVEAGEYLSERLRRLEQ